MCPGKGWSRGGRGSRSEGDAHGISSRSESHVIGRRAEVNSEQRRVALNGHPVSLGTGVLEDDEVTVVPRVQGG
jgi:molybdopterin converting factor small subunit